MNIKTLRIFILFFIVLHLSFNIIAQTQYYSKSKKAIAKFESALYQYKLGYYNQAKTDLNQALTLDNQFIDVYILLGEIANEENQKEEAIKLYQKALSINGDYSPRIYLRKAETLKSVGKYIEAKQNFQKFQTFTKFQKEYGDYTSEKVKQCDFAIEMMKKPLDFKPENLGKNINSPLSEYWPSLTADDNEIVFTVSDRQKNSQEDLYYSTKGAKGWNKAIKIPPPINTEGSEGAQTISVDGKTMIFTACLRPDGLGSCDLYISKKKGKNWTKPINMGSPINSQFKETQPSLSSDGKTLYFVSNRPGGFGKFDIWQSTLKQDGKWDTPLNLGDSINSTEDELAPFIHPDNQTLYFSSEGHLGMGGSDIFISRKDINGKWTKAKNVGYPINTYFNEESLIVTANGEYGLFSSNMDGGFGQKDIYQFKIPSPLKPQKVVFIKGIVYNSKSKEPLQAEINISDLSGQSNLTAESDQESGEFLICITPGKKYAFDVDKTGFMLFSETKFLSDSNQYVKIPLNPIEIGQSAILENVFFDIDSYQLKEESFPELKKLIIFIKKNNVRIEIQGHTDNSGTTIYNQKLSENRAKSVFDYLIKNGIDKKYLKYKGYGSGRPIAGNETETGRAKNRRTAFIIIDNE